MVQMFAFNPGDCSKYTQTAIMARRSWVHGEGGMMPTGVPRIVSDRVRYMVHMNKGGGGEHQIRDRGTVITANKVYFQAISLLIHFEMWFVFVDIWQFRPHAATEAHRQRPHSPDDPLLEGCPTDMQYQHLTPY